MAWRGVIFDLDGTLLNTLDDIASSMNQALTQNGLNPHEVEAYKYMVGDGVNRLVQRAVGEAQEAVAPVTLAYRELYEKNRFKATGPYGGIEDVLHELVRMGLKLCVFSNKPHSDTQAVVEHYFGHIPFAYIFGQQAGTPVKPDPAGALKVLAAAGLQGQETLYVGDTAVDMNCAANAKITSIGVTWGFRTREELEKAGAAFIVDDPAQIISIVKG